MNFSFSGLLWSVFRKILPGMGNPTLQNLASRYEDELASKKFTYTFQEKGHKPFTAVVDFDRSAFCHLMSIGSIVKDVTPDVDEFCGMKGWDNIQDGRITFKMLRQLNVSQFEYYFNEWQMIDQMIETINNPSAVLFDPAKVPGSRLKSDILLYGIYGNRTVHVGISKDDDGTWFARSYFVRENASDRAYPTKYIASMKPLKVRVKASSKKA